MEVIASGRMFLEGVRWRDGRFWASDVFADAIISVTPDGELQELQVGEQPNGLGWTPDGDLLAISRSHSRLLRIRDGRVSVHTDLAGRFRGPANDMVVDNFGRAYIGWIGFDYGIDDTLLPGVIVRVDPDSSVHVAASDVLLPNGMVITEDGQTLIVAETYGQRLTAFQILPNGDLTDRREWARLGAPPPSDKVSEVIAASTFRPDGLAGDAEGCIWVADPLGGRAVRVREGGEILEERRAADGDGVYTCVLGGEDGRSLALCAGPGPSPAGVEKRSAYIAVHRVDVPAPGVASY